MHTGDMGVIKDGELYIIERIKNIVIRNGENYLVSAIEQRIADLLGTSHEHVAVFETDIHDPTSEIVVLVERQDALDDAAVTRLLADFPQESHPVNRLLLRRKLLLLRKSWRDAQTSLGLSILRKVMRCKSNPPTSNI